MSKILVAGAGPVGTPTAIALLKRGHDVTIVAEKLPGEGITGDDAAGIGCIFKPSNERVKNFVLDSYAANMELARDPKETGVRLTRLHIETHGQPQSYSSLVEDYRAEDGTQASYDTFSFDPVLWGQNRIAEFKSLGGKLERRALSPEEVEAINSGDGVSGYDYTHVAIGLKARDIRPQVGLYPIRGMLVHFPETDDIRSDMHERDAYYQISRPNGRALGGTFHEYIGNCSEEEKIRLAQVIVEECNRRFGLSLDFANRTKITVNYRPGVVGGEPILEFLEKVGWANGFGGQGWITWYAVVEYVVAQIEAKLAA